MSKELYLDAHMDLIDEYVKAHPGCSWTEAYEATADQAWERMRENLADMADSK